MKNESIEPKPAMEDGPIYLDVKTFAKTSGVPFATVERLLRDGRIVSVKQGRKRLIHREELARLPEILRS